MRNVLLCLSILCATASVAAAETWIATCTDGKNLQYNQTVDGNGFLYLKGYQVARLDQSFYNQTTICGAVPGNGTGSPATGSNPITQVCANRDRNTIFIQYKHPTEDRPFESEVFCDARVEMR
jgi:hypothetical protein